jgi:hypothetical protein
MTGVKRMAKAKRGWQKPDYCIMIAGAAEGDPGPGPDSEQTLS